MNATKARLGELLVARGALSPEALAHALELHRRTGERLGRVLLSLGYVRRKALYEALSELWNLPFILLTETAPVPEVATRFPPELMLRFRAVPVDFEAGALRVAVADAPSAALVAALGEHFEGIRCRFFVTTEWDIDKAIRELYRDELLDASVYTLYYRSPEESGYTVFTRGQFLALGALVFLLLGCLYAAPQGTLVAINAAVNLVFLVGIGFKFFVSLAGARAEQFEPVTDAEVAALHDAELPLYTVLVPVYREANIVGLLMQNLSQLDYPKEKLEILVLIEEDDPETLEAAKAAHPPDHVQFVIIPDGQPKTKPKACNLGLLFARGEYLVIYDAEDRPDADQLKKAVAAFRKGPESLVCVQGALNYFNWRENFLTRMFTLEYSYWFDYMLPGLARLGLPIPLGGTSNHFRTDRLRELGGWDPFNVTEDADLGIRAAMRGYTVGVINATTFEEANNHVGNWIRQRSRWIKGYMQTALVHARNPLRLVRAVGLKQAAGFALLIAGTPLTFLAAPLLWLLFLVWMLTGTHALDPYFPPWLLYLSLVNLLVGNALAVYLNMLAVFKRGLYALVPFALLNPVYWTLHSRASYKALYQLFTKPFFWEKTLHGLSTHEAQTEVQPERTQDEKTPVEEAHGVGARKGDAAEVQP
ncbi:glycosyltransferase family 2 protein [Truepera radiovictrix]|uniref:General secretory system II protein E domain protein n=1 Tax=Truepera radiovictrix (strain DSM 17093 / CIP 108686 / LMG 22925 / RQ-24) TaxID=649638 RepID=D7CX53_TRURR|nr:glycosyltransferase family 2 protein [Truepera radiovictrix]ADI14561.1 General secretory system II protein E domain protein [Truepera radiovictrix DSM 17093]WMT56889.1 glycosyltransferase family 2 protein [Truepera radiovictrix]